MPLKLGPARNTCGVGWGGHPSKQQQEVMRRGWEQRNTCQLSCRCQDLVYKSRTALGEIGTNAHG
jgi:hypothetical protein